MIGALRMWKNNLFFPVSPAIIFQRPRKLKETWNVLACTPISESEFDLCILTLMWEPPWLPFLSSELPKQCYICYMENYICDNNFKWQKATNLHLVYILFLTICVFKVKTASVQGIFFKDYIAPMLIPSQTYLISCLHRIQTTWSGLSTQQLKQDIRIIEGRVKYFYTFTGFYKTTITLSFTLPKNI